MARKCPSSTSFKSRSSSGTAGTPVSMACLRLGPSMGVSSSVTGSRVSVMMLAELTVTPNNRLAMLVTAAFRSVADPSEAMVADVPTHRRFSLNRSRTRRTSMATSAPCRPRYVCSSSRTTLPNGSFLVVECKNGVASGNGISKKDAGQLGQSVAWFSGRYPTSTSVPIIIHSDQTFGQGASVVAGMRVISSTDLEKLRNNLRGFAKQLVNPDVARSASEVAKRLAQFELNADAFVNAFSVPAQRGTRP